MSLFSKMKNVPYYTLQLLFFAAYGVMRRMLSENRDNIPSQEEYIAVILVSVYLGLKVIQKAPVASITLSVLRVLHLCACFLMIPHSLLGTIGLAIFAIGLNFGCNPPVFEGSAVLLDLTNRPLRETFEQYKSLFCLFYTTWEPWSVAVAQPYTKIAQMHSNDRQVFTWIDAGVYKEITNLFDVSTEMSAKTRVPVIIHFKQGKESGRYYIRNTADIKQSAIEKFIQKNN